MNPGNYVDLSQLTNTGRATPEATLETSLSAMLNGDYEQSLACHTPERKEAELDRPRNREEFLKASQLTSRTIKAFRILAKKTISGEKVQFKITFDYDQEKFAQLAAVLFPNRTIRVPPAIQLAAFIKIGDEWKSNLNDPDTDYRDIEKWDATGEIQVFAP